MRDHAVVPPKHILTTFDEGLTALRNNVLLMSSLTARSLANALNGLRDRKDDLCLQAIADDEEIDQLEKQIDKDGVDLRAGGGSLFLKRHGDLIGPGHAGIIFDGKTNWFSFHFYDGRQRISNPQTSTGFI